jgi:NACHT domain
MVFINHMCRTHNLLTRYLGDMTWMDRLSHTKDASHLAGQRTRCLPGTRTEILRIIEDWIKDPTARRVYWLNGIAGIGKTTIAQTIAELASDIRILGASFFCSHGFNDRRELVHIFRTLAFQLACQYSGYRSHLVDVIKSRPDVASYSLSEQFQQLLLEPLLGSSLKTVIIIDALDECIDPEPASAVLSILAQYVHRLPLVKFFITGRPEPQINAGFRIPSLIPHTETMILHNIKSSSVDRDVATYFRARFSELVAIRTDLGLGEGWPGEQDIAILVRRSSGLFIYAETTFRFISLKNTNPRRQLLIVNSPDTSVNKALLPVDALYTQILHLGYNASDVYAYKLDGLFEQFRTIVGSIVLLFDPMSIDDLALLLNLDPMDVLTSLSSLHSLLVVPDQTSDFVRVIHKSFPDYITDPKRCTDDRFRIDSSTRHAEMTLLCMDLMNKVLKRNICNLPRYVMNDDVSDLSERKKRFISNALEYACKFWADHLHMAKISDKELISKIVTSLNTFFRRYSLPWLEVLSILGKLAVAVHALNKVVQWLSVASRHLFCFIYWQLTLITSLNVTQKKLLQRQEILSGLLFSPSM